MDLFPRFLSRTLSTIPSSSLSITTSAFRSQQRLLSCSPISIPPRRITTRAMSTTLDQKLEALQKYSACDVSDVLLKLQKNIPPGTAPRAGHLADFVPFSPTIGRNNIQPKVIAPASTVKFIAKNDPIPDIATPAESHGYPAGTQWVDWAESGTIAVVEQPAGQYCAVVGGIMALRMKQLGVKGALVNGRVRDLSEMMECGLPVWAQGTSTVGTGAEAKPGARNVPVSVGGVTVSPGDIIFCDPLEGVVAIPRDLLDQVLDVMPKLVAMDDKVKEAVAQGTKVFDAFNQFRTKI